MAATLSDLREAAGESTDQLVRVIRSLLYHVATRDDADQWLTTFRGLATAFPEQPHYAVIATEIEREIAERKKDRLALLREEAA